MVLACWLRRCRWCELLLLLLIRPLPVLPRVAVRFRRLARRWSTDSQWLTVSVPCAHTIHAIQGNASSGLNPPRSLTALMFVDNCFKVASVVSLEPVFNLSKPESICRGLPLDAPLNFRVLLRNHRSRVAVSQFATSACRPSSYSSPPAACQLASAAAAV